MENIQLESTLKKINKGAANGTLRSTTTTFDAERNVNVIRTTVGPVIVR